MPYSVQPGIVFRPSESQIKNLEKKDFIGQAKVLYAEDSGTSPDIPAEVLAAEQYDDAPLRRRLPGGGGTLKRNPTHWQPKLLRRPTAVLKNRSNESTPTSSGASTPVSEKPGGFFSDLKRRPTERRKAPTEEMRTKVGLTPDEAASGPASAVALSRARTLGSSTLAAKRSKSDQDVQKQGTISDNTSNNYQLPSQRLGDVKDIPSEGPTPPSTDSYDSKSPSPALQTAAPPQLNRSPSQPQLATSRSKFPTRKTSLRHVNSKFKKDENIEQSPAGAFERRRSRSFNEGDEVQLAYTTSNDESQPASNVSRSNTLLSKLSGKSNAISSNGMNHNNRKGKPSAIDTLSNVPAAWPRSSDTSPRSLLSNQQHEQPPTLPALQIGEALMGSEATPKPIDNNVALTITPSTPSNIPDKDFSIKFDDGLNTVRDNGTSVPSSVSSNSLNQSSNEGGSPVEALATLNGDADPIKGPFKPTAPLKIHEKPTLSRQASALRRRGTYGTIQESNNSNNDIANSLKSMGIQENEEEENNGESQIRGMSPIETSSLNAEKLLERKSQTEQPQSQPQVPQQQQLNQQQFISSPPTPPPSQAPPKPTSASASTKNASPESKTKQNNNNSLKVRFKVCVY